MNPRSSLKRSTVILGAAWLILVLSALVLSLSGMTERSVAHRKDMKISCLKRETTQSYSWQLTCRDYGVELTIKGEEHE
jgi:hypothetical protein